MVDNLLTITEVAHLLGERHHGRIRRIAVRLGLNTRILRTPKRGKLKPHYSPSEVESIRRQLDKEEALHPPSGNLSVIQIANRADCSPKAVRIAILQLKLRSKIWVCSHSGRSAAYFSPHQVSRLVRHLAVGERGNEYYLTEASKLLGRSGDWVTSHIKSLGMITRFRRDDSGRKLRVIKSKDLDLLITESERYSWAGRNQLTIGGLSAKLRVDWRSVQRLLPICSVDPVVCYDRRGVPRYHYDIYTLAELRFAMELVDQGILKLF